MSDDLIKREDAIANIEMLLDDISDIQDEDELKEIKAYNLGVWASLNSIKHHVPSADRPQGGWVRYMGDIWTCTACGESLMCDDIKCNNYCPNCGARMKGADDD